MSDKAMIWLYMGYKMKKNDDDSNKWLAHLFPLEFAHCQIATLLLYALLVLQHAVEDVNKLKTVTCSQCPKVMKLFEKIPRV